jgi:NAD(P)-dependent dehydrogenase (short-subunit alcohol dehydrogenase family)
MRMTGLSGARVVVTGAGGGIGGARSVAGFRRLGAQVVACDLPGADLTAPGIAERHSFDLRDRAGGRLPPPPPSSRAGCRASSCRTPAGPGPRRWPLTTPEALDDEMARNFTGAARLTLGLLPADAGR